MTILRVAKIASNSYVLGQWEQESPNHAYTYVVGSAVKFKIRRECITNMTPIVCGFDVPYGVQFEGYFIKYHEREVLLLYNYSDVV